MDTQKNFLLWLFTVRLALGNLSFWNWKHGDIYPWFIVPKCSSEEKNLVWVYQQTLICIISETEAESIHL